MAGSVNRFTGQMAGPIASAQAQFSMQVKRTGRVKLPNLADPQLKAIGEKMVAEQKARWVRSVDSTGQAAKKLSVRWAIIKQAVMKKPNPKRDMVFSGRTLANFQLRRAAESRIRAENSTRKERDKARGCNNLDQMIGFSLTDAKVVFDAAKEQYGQWVNRAWIPMDGTTRRPNMLNRV